MKAGKYSSLCQREVGRDFKIRSQSVKPVRFFLVFLSKSISASPFLLSNILSVLRFLLLINTVATSTDMQKNTSICTLYALYFRFLQVPPRIVQFIDRIIEVPEHPMTVNVIGYLEAGMTQLIAHVAYVVAPQQPARGVGMSQVVYLKKIKRLQSVKITADINL